MAEGINALKAALRQRLGQRQNGTLADRRARTDGIALFGAPGVTTTSHRIMLGTVPAGRFDPAEIRRDGCIIYIHGGAFVAGSPTSHAYISSCLAARHGAPVFALDYRLAPEHVYPAALDDVVIAIDAAAAQFGSRGQVAVVGDSAGGTLALLAAMRLGVEGDNVRRAALISPLVDFRCVADSYERLAGEDPFINRPGLMQDIAMFLGDLSPAAREISPLAERLSGLPPILIQVGSSEVLLDDAIALEQKIRTDGGRVRLSIWPEMVHVWHLFPHFVDESGEAIAEIADFLAED